MARSHLAWLGLAASVTWPARRATEQTGVSSMAVSPERPAFAGQSFGNTVVPDDRSTHWMNRASWGAIIAGVVAALVIQLLLNMLGVGIGLSSVTAANAGDNLD